MGYTFSYTYILLSYIEILIHQINEPISKFYNEMEVHLRVHKLHCIIII